MQHKIKSSNCPKFFQATESLLLTSFLFHIPSKFYNALFAFDGLIFIFIEYKWF